MGCIVCKKECSKNKYCSEKCHRQYWREKNRKNYEPADCIVCGNKYTPLMKMQKYCSSKCKSIYEGQKRSKKPKTKECKMCSGVFLPYTSLDKFCSANCRIEYAKKNRSKRWKDTSCIMGEKNPAYRNGQYVRGRKKITEGERIFIRNSKQIKSNMIDQHNRLFCQHCGTYSSIKFEAHHIVFRSEKPLHEHLHDAANILICCIGCHNMFHKNKSLRNDIVNERGLANIFGSDVLNK